MDLVSSQDAKAQTLSAHSAGIFKADIFKIFGII
jgi:hypothetical protein